MKNLLYSLLVLFSVLFSSCGDDKKEKELKSINYTVVLDLSDRILAPNQLDKDCFLIEKMYHEFETKARRNLIVTSKDLFSVKIISQKNSPLNTDSYEDELQLYLDEIVVKDKNKSVQKFGKSLPSVLNKLKNEAKFSMLSTDYFGVDIWAFMHDNGIGLSKMNYKNTILVITDGYFDFESQNHVIKDKNQYTSTHFLNELNATTWKQTAESQKYGLLPVLLNKNTKWIVAGLSGKIPTDILQTEKITYFWNKWLSQSGVSQSKFILNSAKKEMGASLLEQLQN